MAAAELKPTEIILLNQFAEFFAGLLGIDRGEAKRALNKFVIEWNSDA